jgi:D-alanyl-D-alanine carboxypeptidase/D-alanyl-D-alanine-endopeptidase (penicillin-binding protein 4)
VNHPRVSRALAGFVASLALAIATGCAAHAAPQSAAAPANTREASQTVRDLRSQLATVFNAPVTAHGTWGVHVRSLDRAEVLFELNANKLMMPASNMKILTLAATAERLGWDHTFTTTLETHAAIENGILRGDLFIRGGGDPTISARGKRSEIVFDEWAATLRQLGISSVEGRIIGDDQAFDDEGIGPGWAWDYLEAGYAAPSGALQYNDNAASLVISPGSVAGDPAIVEIAPGSGLTIVNRVLTRERASDDERSAINVRRRIDGPVIEVSGSIPVGAPPVSRTVAVLNPTLFFAQNVKNALAARGIPVTGEAADIDDVVDSATTGGEPERRLLLTTTSPPLLDIATVLMKVSQNQYAETFLKALGAADGSLGTTAAGRREAAEIFTSWGIPQDGFVISDGSGLSRYNYTTPAAITAILARLHADPRHREPFIATLPIAGKDGTIASRMRRSLAEGNAVAKTGSIANTRALSGYVKTGDGETLAFSIIANDFVAASATVTWIADLAVEILAAFQR